MDKGQTQTRAPGRAGEIKIAHLMIAAALSCVTVSASAQPPPARVDPRAVDALTRMSAYLRTVPAFEIKIQTQRDDVDVYGQLITLSGKATYKVRAPDAFAFDLALPTQSGRYVYDGKTVTAYDAPSNAYKTFQAPATIRATLDLAEQQYGANVPLADLFTWSAGDNRAGVLTSAHVIGKAEVNGQAAMHYAFRQPGKDWQVWIADGDKPTPLRISIIASDDPARPEFQADLAWNTTPRFEQDAFVFKTPPNARPIP